MTTEKELMMSSFDLTIRDINEHLVRIQELTRKAEYYQACIRDNTLTDDEFVAVLDARIWWEERGV